MAGMMPRTPEEFQRWQQDILNRQGANPRGAASGDQQDYDNTTYGGQARVYGADGSILRESSANLEAARALKASQDAQARQGAQVSQAEQQRDYAGFQGQMGMSDASRAQQMGAYGQQQAATDRYAAMARGEGPSLASALMNQGQNNIRAAQTSAAASARGPAGLAMAQQNAAGNMAAQGQQLNAQLGQMRNQEQMAAMQGYAQGAQGLSSAAGQMRAQDQSGAGLYGQQRGISAQNAQAQAGFQQNQNALNDQRAMQYEQLRNGIYSQGVDNTLKREQMQRAGRREASDDYQSDKDEAARWAGTAASTVGSAMMFMSDVSNKTDIAPIDSGAKTVGGLGAALGSFGGALQGKGATYAAPMPMRGSSADAKPAMRAPAAQPLGQGQVDLTGVDPTSVGYQRFSPQAAPGIVTPAGFQMDFGGPVSDERSKQKIASLSDALMRSQAAMYNAPSPIQETLRTTQPYAFNYKPGYGEDPGQRHVGIMAQDLEKTPAGSTLVKEGPKGKMIDGKQAVGFNLAAAADLQKQIDALKAERMAQSQMAMYSAPVAVRGQ